MFSSGIDEEELLKRIELHVQEGDGAAERAVGLLHGSFEHYDWVGIYRVEGDHLVLDTYVGKPTEHTRIPVGEGICGAAVSERATMLIQDVLSDPRFIACSPDTRSEIVVPIWSGDRIVAEIDIDSDTPNAFTDRDRQFLERAASLLSVLYQ